MARDITKVNSKALIDGITQTLQNNLNVQFKILLENATGVDGKQHKYKNC